MRIFSTVFGCLLVFVLTLPAFQAAAQKTNIQGVVSDDKGQPLNGVTIAVKKAHITVTSDKRGAFNLDVPGGNNVLVFTYVGMESREVALGTQVFIRVVMQPVTKNMNDVVVIGYGTVKRKDLTGSVGSIKGDDLLKTIPTSINEAMQGQLAGVDVQRNDGAPGAGISIQVRGANSFSSSTEPLYVIDGIPFGAAPTPANVAGGQNGGVDMMQTVNPLSTLNPADIESIDVLKDASATAIYGVRGANGVVMITTKKGRSGQEKLEFSSNFGFASISKRLKMLDGYQYALFQNEATVNRNYYEGGNGGIPYSGDSSLDPLTGKTIYNPKPEDFLHGYLHGGTNWQDEIFQNAITSDYSLRVSGGNDKGSYSVSGNYTDQPGIIVNSSYKRYALQTNFVRKVHNWIEIGSATNLSKGVYNLAKTNSDWSNVLNSALHFPSTYPVFDSATASGVSQIDWFSANPWLYVRDAKDVTTAFGIYSANYAQINFAPWLNFRQNIGYNGSINSRQSYYNRFLSEGKQPVNGAASRGDNNWTSTIYESILSFNRTFGDHSINAVGGITFEHRWWDSKSIYVYDFPTDITEDNDLHAALSTPLLSSDRGEERTRSFLGRINYGFKDRYLFTASFRNDGSSNFAQNYKTASFPSAAVAWKVSEEDFFKDQNLFSNLKFRASWGQTGNSGIGPYQADSKMVVGNASVNGTIVSGYYTPAPANPNLKWETTTQEDLGVDIGLLKNRLNITVDVYHKLTTDLLQNIVIPSSSGYGSYVTNSGNVMNKGLEVAVQGSILKGPGLNWDVNANISFNRNRIGGLAGDQFAHRLWSGYDQVFLQRNGQPIGAIYGYVEQGFYNNEAEVRADPAYAGQSEQVIRAMIGERKYKNLDKDPTSIGTSDRTIIGNVNPNYSFGITNNFSFKNFNLSIFVQGVEGRQIVNSNLLNMGMGDIANITEEAYNDRWTPTNTVNAKWPKANASYNRRHFVSNTLIEDGSYVRLKSVNLGYTFRNPVKGLDLLNFYVAMNNVFVITKYSWYDPDVNSFGSDPSSRGVDMNAYPNTRTVNVGLRATF